MAPLGKTSQKELHVRFKNRDCVVPVHKKRLSFFHCFSMSVLYRPWGLIWQQSLLPWCNSPAWDIWGTNVWIKTTNGLWQSEIIIASIIIKLLLPRYRLCHEAITRKTLCWPQFCRQSMPIPWWHRTRWALPLLHTFPLMTRHSSDHATSTQQCIRISYTQTKQFISKCP